MSRESLAWYGDPTTDEGCLSGCYWGDGGICSRCGQRLRCGACGRFVTIATITQHINERCPVKWLEYEGGPDDAEPATLPVPSSVRR